jgi:hypothetical protein
MIGFLALVLYIGWFAGLTVLRAPSYLLRSSLCPPSLEAGADAHSRRPVPQVADKARPPKIRRAHIPEGGDVRSACQHLPVDPHVRCPSVASAKTRGGRSLPTANQHAPRQRSVLPILSFPEPGLDDSAAYQGYRTRFYRDSKNNTIQIYLQPRSSRVVLVWADAANESAGFTVRDAAGRPARLEWGAVEADVSDSAATRSIEFRLTAYQSNVQLGWFLLGSMRVERDFVYARRHLEPFTAPPFRVAEESLLVADVARLPVNEREGHLALLGAGSIDELRSRLEPAVTSSCSDTICTVRAERPSLDGKNRLTIELGVDYRHAKLLVSEGTVSIQTRPGAPLTFAVKVTTDAAPLSPLSREQIFNRPFLDLLASANEARDPAAMVRFRRLERQVRGVELLSSEEKLMAGLPNFATYFGRDMMMTALMMRPIWSPEMPEHVIASVLRKLGPRGDVSHEEALGGQAIRENAVEYDSLITRYFRLARVGQRGKADLSLRRARAVLRDLQQTRENYHMIDDEFQLPVLAARYLADSAVTADRKRSFLLEKPDSGATRLVLLLRELGLVSSLAEPYRLNPKPTRLVSFPKRDATHWRSASWRDSDAGYAGGRFAMDINVIWVPQALESIGTILQALSSLGFPAETLGSIAPEIGGTPLERYAQHPESVDRAVAVWKGARRHFEITLSADEIRQRTGAKLAWLPQAERAYWQKVMAQRGEVKDSLTFLVLSLDPAGRPIPVVNTDPATELFLDASLKPEAALEEVAVFMRPYPVGLFVDRLGPLVANDAYASQQIWERFQNDQYHGSRVVWGREVNLFLIGLANQIFRAPGPGQGSDVPADTASFPALRDALRRTLAAVSTSGLQHNELWSYQIKGSRLVPVRYGTSSDVQLWNTTNLVVQYVLSKLPRESP